MNTEKEPEKNTAAEAEANEAESAAAETAEAQAEPASVAADAQASAETEETETAEAAAPETDDAEPEETPQKTGKKAKKTSAFFHSEKFKHGSAATAFTAGFIAVVILLNVIVGILVDRYPSLNLDITKNSNNTLSAEALEIVDKVDIPVEITICATKAACENGSVSEYSGDYSEVNSLLTKAAERNSNITLKYVDLDADPIFAQQYKSDSIATGDVVVKSDKRYRVLTSSDLFTSSTDSSTYETTYYSNVDSSLASALNAVMADTMPIVAFETGHDEQMDTTGYKKVLENNSFEVEDFSLLTEDIPENTQILVLSCPKTDLTDEEITKVETYLHNTDLAANRSLIVMYSAGYGDLTTLDAYLAEWGLSCNTSTVIAETSSSKYYSNQLITFSDVGTDVTLNSSSTTYSNLLTPYSSPVTLSGTSIGLKSLYSIVSSSDTATVISTGDTTQTISKGSSTIIGLSQETVKSGSDSYYANVILSGSAMMFNSTFLTSSVFGNGSFVADLSRYATGTTSSTTDVVTTKRELYTKDISVTESGIRWMGVGLFTILIPLAVAVAGIIIYRRRRTL